MPIQIHHSAQNMNCHHHQLLSGQFLKKIVDEVSLAQSLITENNRLIKIGEVRRDSQNMGTLSSFQNWKQIPHLLEIILKVSLQCMPLALGTSSRMQNHLSQPSSKQDY